MAISDEEYEAATRRGAEEQARVPPVEAVSYNGRTRELAIHFASGMRLVMPIAILQDLHDAPPAALREVKLEGAGTVLYWPRLDRSLWLPGLLEGHTGTRRWMAAQLGARGGAAKTEAKAAAARRNGQRGGRPRKKAAA
jgi:Protein of unknown function (DUF2442)